MVEDESQTMKDLVEKALGAEGTPEEADTKADAMEGLCDRVVSIATRPPITLAWPSTLTRPT